MFKLIKKIIKACLPYGIISLSTKINKFSRTQKIINKYHDSNSHNIYNDLHSKKLIYMADETRYAGGLADRLRGMVSLYKIARNIGTDFKIYFTSPAALTHYLVPNLYDWCIEQSDIIYDLSESVICKYGTPKYDDAGVQKEIQRLLKQYNQIHITTNIPSDLEYNNLFTILFKPSPELRELIEYNLSQIGREFISATFRFQALLGDFYEGNYPVLPENKRLKLLGRCLEHLEEIHRENKDEKILVTSDSITFLNEAKKYDFVYVIPGKIAHIAFSPGLDKEIYMKSFVDYFVLTYSKKIYLVIDGQMYNSGFPYRASLHKSPPYIIKKYT
jgi:hypothetical protein